MFTRLPAKVKMDFEKFSMFFAKALLIFNIESLILFNADISELIELFNISRNSMLSNRSSLTSFIRNESFCDASYLRSRHLFFSINFETWSFELFFLFITLLFFAVFKYFIIINNYLGYQFFIINNKACISIIIITDIHRVADRVSISSSTDDIRFLFVKLTSKWAKFGLIPLFIGSMIGDPYQI